MYDAAAFAPGHISGFFGVYDSHPHGALRGSRGGGVCIDRGAWSRISLSDDGRIRVFVDGEESSAPVTRLALSMMLGDREMGVDVDIRLDLPLGQGFGMSSAGTLASAVALGSVLQGDVSPDPLTCTHLAEVAMRTGMGDAVAQSLGGLVIREREGLPPRGIARRADCGEFVICVVGEPISTRDMLGRDDVLDRTREASSGLLPVLSSRLDMNTFVMLSRRFAEETGLVTQSVRAALDAVDKLASGSMVMLGNAVFCDGGKEVMDALSAFGDPVVVRASDGARVVDLSQFPAGEGADGSLTGGKGTGSVEEDDLRVKAHHPGGDVKLKASGFRRSEEDEDAPGHVIDILERTLDHRVPDADSGEDTDGECDAGENEEEN